jgi:hypothetical protein
MTAIQQNSAHADETAVFNGTTVNDGPVPHCNAVTYVQWIRSTCYVQYALILNVGLGSNTNVIHISTDYGTEPDA